MDGLDGTGLQLDGLDWFKTFIGDQKLKKILYRQLEKVIFPAVTMRLMSFCSQRSYRGSASGDS